MRGPVDAPVAVSPRLTIWHLSGEAYERNASWARMKNHQQVAAAFRKLAPAQLQPDAILCSLPTLELCDAAVDYGRARLVPVALDIRDLWPDVLYDMLPPMARPLFKLATRQMTRQLERAARGATALLGVTDEFVGWGLEAAGRSRNKMDRAFPMAYSSTAPDAEALEKARAFWAARGIDERTKRPIVCFFGTLGWMFDFNTVLDAASRIAEGSSEILFVICGDGNRAAALRQRAAQMPNVLMPGRVGAAEVWWLMRRSIAGLAPYRPFRNFDDNLPNKPIEYLSAGLPIVACRLKVLSRLVEQHHCGLTYAHGDDAALANALVSLSKDPAMRERMSRAGERLYNERFVAERVYEDMSGHIEALAAGAVRT